MREKRRKRCWEGKKQGGGGQTNAKEKKKDEERREREEREEKRKKRRKKEFSKLRRNLMVPTASELFSSGVEDCGGGAFGRRERKY